MPCPQENRRTASGKSLAQSALSAVRRLHRRAKQAHDGIVGELARRFV